MPKTVEVKLYQFDELSDKAKEKARQWWRDLEAQDFGGFGDIYDDYLEAGKLLGITFDPRPVKLMGGSTRYDPKIWWMLHNQGAGASFEGTYEYAKGSVKAIKSTYPTEVKLHQIAEGLHSLQKRYAYKLTARVTADGRDVHKYAMSIESGVDSLTIARRMKPEEISSDEDALLGLMRDFADWIYEGIQQEWDYRMSDENIDESIRINEYWFREDGERSDG